MECIVLAGGLGTRLQGVIGQQPKCMAPVNDLPFLSYLFRFIDRTPITRVVLSLGFQSHIVTRWLEDQFLKFELDYVVENEPLGTGGGILAAIEECETDNVVVLNGDTMFMPDLRKMMKFHVDNKSATTLALKEMHQFDRYGVVNINAENKITSFEEKKFQETGNINGGVYIINRDEFMKKPLRQKFSFEKDYLEAFVGEGNFYGFASDAYFIDIGIPQDYEKAQTDFKTLFV